jgi:MFS family permease
VLGIVEGIAEATAQVSRVFSGWLSDALGRRKALTVLGYGLAATKPLFPLANSIGLVLAARFSIASAREFAACPAMRWSPTSRLPL